MVQFSTTVNASLEKVWEHLLVKIEKPENFVPDVSHVIILDKNDEVVTREMTIKTEENATTLVEEITFKPYKVRFLLLKHPNLKVM